MDPIESNFDGFLDILSEKLKKDAVVDQISKNSTFEERAFKILVSTSLSARTKDETTAKVSKNLFRVIQNPEDLLNIPINELEKLVYPAGFYKTKSKNLKELGKILVEKYNSKIPNSIDELVKLPGVGRKTANLVMTLAFSEDAICVDTHVHRITNRLNYVDTKNPNETEMALRKKLPKKYWKQINNSLVIFGQDICGFVPKCSSCFPEIKKICPYYSSILEILKIYEKYNFKKVSKTKIPRERGTYVLRIKINNSKNILVGKKEIQFEKGDYFYIGSAMGNSLNLYNRINRHLSDEKKKRWHIDYLLEFGNIKEIYVTDGSFECSVSKDFEAILKGIFGFGCSDCKCKSHLYFLKP
ncbi:DNA-(apurinic or apyrimidinic site) lyase [Methanococcus vannielii SB]|uniref:thymine-DNA glycosylase n=1 Tax=Methanococcus vannielii (strain ATCC 35089 / DSM 1224 / JCM 13029 / OCM 148 / SB) TaxID=406327 RepID=A6USW1_METVS|nr:DUF123 domain-containing protein [Methanococcus vannielii]ABR55583.1 DNA-(apurinic or apyrimidinic site) lyase [Methanococcus vannielii SB]